MVVGFAGTMITQNSISPEGEITIAGGITPGRFSSFTGCLRHDKSPKRQRADRLTPLLALRACNGLVNRQAD